MRQKIFAHVPKFIEMCPPRESFEGAEDCGDTLGKKSDIYPTHISQWKDQQKTSSWFDKPLEIQFALYLHYPNELFIQSKFS